MSAWAPNARGGHRLAALGAGLAAASAVLAPPAHGSHLRTALMSGAPGVVADDASFQPALSLEGHQVAFVSRALNLGGLPFPGRGGTVYARDRISGALRLVSAPPDGLPADGPSGEPAIADNGNVVAWTSTATNLVPEDTNGVADVFARGGDAPPVLVSTAADGGQSNGASGQPTLSRDGRYVAFTSSASNLVVGGDTNGVRDVFVRDLVTGLTGRMSVDASGRQANGPSANPTLSGNGRVISFTSRANNLVPEDTNGVDDVFVRIPTAGVTARASVRTGGEEQNRAVGGPFPQVSSLSDDGRFVAFDSDATNLVRRDVNRHTDVFIRDRTRATTVLASLSSANVQGDSDSFFPTVSGDGSHVAFSSLAGNLAPDDAPREDAMLRDLAGQTTSVIGVPNAGGRRAPEGVRQLLQRPQLTADAEVGVFTSTAGNLVSGDTNERSDVFARMLRAPRTTRARLVSGGTRPTFRLSSSDPQATSFLCALDGAAPVDCKPGTYRVPRRLAAGRHRLLVRAGGPGLKYHRPGRTVTFRTP